MSDGRWLGVEIAVAAAVFLVLVARVPTVDHFLVNNDHGHELAGAVEVLRGRVPGVDVVSNYGPLAVILRAGAFYLDPLDPPSLIGEVLACAAAWAGAIWLALRFVRRHFGGLAGLTAAGLAFASLPRFHKWWLWVVPLATLLAVDDARRSPGPRRWAVAGLLAGLGFLVRPDLGMATLGSLVLLGLADQMRASGRWLPAAWMPLATGFVAPVLAWAAVLLVVSGGAGLRRAAGLLPEMLFGTVESLRLAPPPFRWDAPLAPASAHALALRLLPASNLLAIAIGWWLWRDPNRGLVRSGRALFASGLFGLGAYHYVIYRADIYHLWQGMWPLALTVPGLAAVAVRLARGRPSVRRGAADGGVVLAGVGVVATTVALTPIYRQPHYDLAPWGRPLLAGIRELRRGPDAAPAHPYAQLVDSIRRYSAPNDDVLVLVYGGQLLYFADRPTHGPTIAFQRGLFDSPAWRAERLALLQRHPPALVVVPMDFWRPRPGNDLDASLPEIAAWVRAHYTRVLDRRGRHMLLGPDPAFRPPTA